MKKLITKFGGVIFFYTAIVGMILMMNYRFRQLNRTEEVTGIICVSEVDKKDANQSIGEV